MKAVVQIGYGHPVDVLRIADVDVPALGDDSVRVLVEAASVNALDWHTTRGIPKIMRLTDGQQAPRSRVRGIDLAGVVEATGKNVTAFRPGDRVFGGADGSFAEHAVTSPARLARLGDAASFEQGATLCVAGLTALQALRDKARVVPGERVIVLGAGGGVGVFAVQLAAWLGARVTAVTRTTHVDLAHSSGAEIVIDYLREDFTRRPERHDVMVVVGGTRSLADCLRVLRRPGRLVIVGGPTDQLRGLAARILGGIALSPLTRKRVTAFVAKSTPADLALLGELVVTGRLRPMIDRRYPLDDGVAAIASVGSGAVRGKVVIVPR